jgi:hypothetical protein
MRHAALILRRGQAHLLVLTDRLRQYYNALMAMMMNDDRVGEDPQDEGGRGGSVVEGFLINSDNGY